MPDDDKDRATVPGFPKKLRVGVSRQDAKRIRNLHMGEIARMTDGRERAYQELTDEVHKLQRQVEFAKRASDWLSLVVLGCIQRFGGTLVFDRQQLMDVGAARELVPEVTDERVSVTSRAKLVAVETPSEVESS